MKKALSLMLAMTLMITLGLACGPSSAAAASSAATSERALRYEGPGFDTPEAAVACYLEGLKNLDFEQMLSAFAWETQVSHYDVNAFYERVKAYVPSAKPRMPSFNSFMQSANLHALRSAQTDAIYRSLEAYLLGEEYPAGKTISLREEGAVSAFLQQYDNGRLEKLAAMSDIQFLSPDAVTNNRFSSEPSQRNFAQMSAQYGADEVVNVFAAASVGDETLICCPTAARYGDRWYLVSTSSLTANLIGIGVDYQAFACGPGSLQDFMR